VQYILADDVLGHPPGQLVGIGIEDSRIASAARLKPRDLPLVVQQPNLLDLRGQLVLPGLIDCHIHAISTGMLMLGHDLRDIHSRDELADAIRSAAGTGEDFVRLAGLDLSRIPQAERALITREWLDALVPDRPLAVKSVEGHSSWFNTRGWERVGVMPVLQEHNIGVDEIRSMWDSGRLHGGAYELLTTPVYDSFTAEERRRGMELVIAEAKRVGLTGLHCLEGYGERKREDFELILELAQRGDIGLTLYCRDETPDLAHELGQRRFGGCWCVDGAIGAHSAAVGSAYADKPHHCGELYHSDDALRAWIRRGLELDMQVCVHAIGDRALDQVIGLYEELAPEFDLPRLRPRLDHFVLGTAAQAKRAAQLGCGSAMQPAFDARWGGASGGYAMRLGPERALESNPVGTMLRTGLPVAGSSDSYITPLDPLGGIRAAMQHHNPAHRVDFNTAVELFTWRAAWLSHEDDRQGRIAPGYQADFTVVSDADADRGPSCLDAASVHSTIKLGRVVYSATPVDTPAGRG
jgi:predicted amidohydrolase YtcJ